MAKKENGKKDKSREEEEAAKRRKEKEERKKEKEKEKASSTRRAGFAQRGGSQGNQGFIVRIQTIVQNREVPGHKQRAFLNRRGNKAGKPLK